MPDKMVIPRKFIWRSICNKISTGGDGTEIFFLENLVQNVWDSTHLWNTTFLLNNWQIFKISIQNVTTIEKF